MSTHVYAAGGVVVRQGFREAEVVMIHRPKYDDWSFPKGKVDPGESLEETALREVYEETALRCTLAEPMGIKEYPGKTVHYWKMQVSSEEALVPNDEVDELRWVPVSEAAQWLSYRQDRELLSEP